MLEKTGRKRKADVETNQPETGSPNPTRDKLAGLPFETATELKSAQQEINLHVWKRLEEARQLHLMAGRPEFAFFNEEINKGFACEYGEHKRNLVRVYADESEGIKILINRDLAESAPSTEIIGVLVKSMSESYASTYYKAKGILPSMDISTVAKEVASALAQEKESGPAASSKKAR